MKTFRLACTLAASAVLCATAAHAQMPTDNDTWKLRCNLLHDNVTRIGVAPPWALELPAKVPGPQYTTFGWDRARAAQPNVACVFFYLGAIADHNGPANHADHIHSIESSTMGLIEWQLARKQGPTARQKITKMHAEAAEIPKSLLTEEQEQAMFAAASTMPIHPPAQ